MHGIRQCFTFNVVSEILFSVELGGTKIHKPTMLYQKTTKVTKQLTFVVRTNSILAALIAYNYKLHKKRTNYYSCALKMSLALSGIALRTINIPSLNKSVAQFR